uniref:Cell division protein FtsZ n=1 Tax=Candidatus Methanophaga sp. ANME-1 ERB7 TaxID=2759913 RepID=A0A7G9Z877_9EURY|nr:cell division protein FtsZ [Methanosarcinales archaeon ANME-1 ERB7]
MKVDATLEDKDFVFIVAGMGGGTGSGTSPIIARIAKEEGAFVVCLVTLPFKVEEKRRIRAKEWLKRLRKEADRVVTFDNETLLEDVPNLPLNKAFSVMTQLMAINIKGTFEMIKDSEHSIAKKREWINQKLKEILKHTKAENKYPLSDSNLSRELKSKIISLIKENCILKEKRENIAKIYDQLFKIIETHCYLTIDIFTANYDPVIENYIKNLSFLTYDIGHDELTKLGCHLYYDGFQNSIWHPEGYDENIARDLDDMIIVRNEKGETLIEEYTENKILPIFRLFKLHGSIDQYYQNGEIIKKDILFPTKTVEGVELKDSMIYPMREKEVYEDPFFELFTRLKNSLLSEKICIVIGYSFGDEHIRNIFFDAMKRNPEIKIFMINPKAKEIRDDLKPIKDKIDPIEGEFGEESIFEELEEKLKELEGI